MEDGEGLAQEFGGLALDVGAAVGGLALGGAQTLDVRAGLAQGAAGVAPQGAGLVGAGPALRAYPVRGRAASCAALAEVGSDSSTR
ncbi:hypothetical protein [Streptomyces sp. NBC_00439]|uniref:hypothetical protein n=1 Tax=Streptomyces sp. NBC_00439 TaxID=2903650 RepID=UPI00224E8429|nr:hypothetical protein [Streptomyces sp. NBC_00439]MCX5098192.1 hypothetical protein [Streptomyces sp. NBC_00439]